MFNDETDGHIDNLACFVRPGEVCLSWTERRRDPQYAISRDAFERLQQARDARGRRLKVTRLPLPGPLYLRAREARGIVAREGTKPRTAGERLAASYVNFSLANRALIMPLLHDRTDALPPGASGGCSRRGAWSGSRRARSCWAAAASRPTQQIPAGTRTRSPSAP